MEMEQVTPLTTTLASFPKLDAPVAIRNSMWAMKLSPRKCSTS